MALPNQLKRFFNYTVQIASKTGVSSDGYNNPTYGTPRNVPAKMELSSQALRTDAGNEITSPRKIFLYTQDVPSVEDQITLPSPFVPTNPKILAVRVVTDVSRSKINHVVVMTE